MIIICDSREIRNSHILAEFSKQGIDFKIKKLEFGDYTIEGMENTLVIERKANFTELAGNFCKGRNRFEVEFCKGITAGAKMVLLLEEPKAKEKLKLRKAMDEANIDLETRFRKTWRSKFTGNSMIASINAFKERYNLELVSCSKKETGKKIIEIFQKEVKENGKRTSKTGI